MGCKDIGIKKIRVCGKDSNPLYICLKGVTTDQQGGSEKSVHYVSTPINQNIFKFLHYKLQSPIRLKKMEIIYTPILTLASLVI